MTDLILITFVHTLQLYTNLMHLTHETSLTPSLFIQLPMSSQERICVRGIDLHFSTIFGIGFLNCSDSVGFFVCHFIHMYLERCRLAQWHSNSSHFNLWNAILCIYIEIENYEWRLWFQFIYLVTMRECQYIETWYKHPLAMKIGDLI